MTRKSPPPKSGARGSPEERHPAKWDPVRVSLMNRIGDHFDAENRLMRDMLKTQLTEQEWELVDLFIAEHPHSKFVRRFHALARGGTSRQGSSLQRPPSFSRSLLGRQRPVPSRSRA